MSAAMGPTMLDAILGALREAALYNKQEQTPPAAVLWTDGERRWQALLPRLRSAAANDPPLLTLGAYVPAERTGPAIWRRTSGRARIKARRSRRSTRI